MNHSELYCQWMYFSTSPFLGHFLFGHVGELMKGRFVTQTIAHRLVIIIYAVVSIAEPLTVTERN